MSKTSLKKTVRSKVRKTSTKRKPTTKSTKVDKKARVKKDEVKETPQHLADYIAVSHSWHQLWVQTDIVRIAFIDTETDGVTDKNLLEIGILRARKGTKSCLDLTPEQTVNAQHFELEDYYQSLIKTESVDATEIHHITLEECREKGQEEATVLTEFMGRLAHVDLVVAHNVSFDKTAIEMACLRNGVNFNWPPYFFDTRTAAIEGFGHVMSLSTLRTQLGVLENRAIQYEFHRVAQDISALVVILDCIVDRNQRLPWSNAPLRFAEIKIALTAIKAKVPSVPRRRAVVRPKFVAVELADTTRFDVSDYYDENDETSLQMQSPAAEIDPGAPVDLIPHCPPIQALVSEESNYSINPINPINPIHPSHSSDEKSLHGKSALTNPHQSQPIAIERARTHVIPTVGPEGPEGAGRADCADEEILIKSQWLPPRSLTELEWETLPMGVQETLLSQNVYRAVETKESKRAPSITVKLGESEKVPTLTYSDSTLQELIVAPEHILKILNSRLSFFKEQLVREPGRAYKVPGAVIRVGKGSVIKAKTKYQLTDFQASQSYQSYLNLFVKEKPKR